MTFIKINEILYPVIVSGRVSDTDWDCRESKSITIEMDYKTAACLFVDGTQWSIVQCEEYPIYEKDESGNRIETGIDVRETEYDNSDYCIAGDLTDHRDGRVTVKMGKLTALEEAYEIMFGGM